MKFQATIIKGMLWNGEFFIGRFPADLPFVETKDKVGHRAVVIPALVAVDDCVVKEVDKGELDRLLPNAVITSPYNIKFDGLQPENGLWLNNENPFTKEDQEKILKAFETLKGYGLMSSMGM
jgi:hypothetical protein